MDKVLSTIGLASAAKKVTSGEEAVSDAISNGKIHLVFLGNDVGKNTKKSITNKCNYYKVPLCTNYNIEELTNAIGKKNRVVLGIKDKGFSENLLSKLR